MNIQEELLPNNVVKIHLSGRMDIAGVGEIETRFAGMTASPRMAIIVDMAQVPFMSSIGIRALLINAKAVSKRGGKLVLLSPEENVEKVLTTSGINQIIPICHSQEEAISKVTA